MPYHFSSQSQHSSNKNNSSSWDGLQRAAIHTAQSEIEPQKITPTPTTSQKDFSHIPVKTGGSKFIQPKLQVSQVGDRAEQEADRVAEQVAGNLKHPQTPNSPANTRSITPSPVHLQRNLQSSRSVPAAVEAEIQQASGKGMSLSDEIRSPMEQGFDTDFSHVKVHTDAHAHRLNQAINARAFTTGGDLFFRQGEYQPGSDRGRRLLAHELTHVMQQSHATHSHLLQRVEYSAGGKLSQDYQTADIPRFKQQISLLPQQRGLEELYALQKYLFEDIKRGKTEHNEETALTIVEHVIEALLSGTSAEEVGEEQPDIRSKEEVPDVRQNQPSSTGDSGQKINWKSAREEDVKPSSGGAMGGVMFITVGGVKHVIKPVKGSPARAVFGEAFLEAFGGAVIPKSQPIKVDSEEGQEIAKIINRKLLQDIEKAEQAASGSTQSQDPKAAREQAQALDDLKKKHTFYKNADYFLLQQNLSGPTFSKAFRQDTTGFLQNKTLMYNVGRTTIADVVIGNADRFEMFNPGNAFLLVDKIGAIDTEAILQSFQAIVTDPTQIVGTATEWVTALLETGATAISSGGGGGVPSSSIVNVTADFEHWFENQFKGEIEGRLNKESKESPPKEVWESAKAEIRRGMNDTLKLINEYFSDERRKQLKSQFRGAEAKYGADPNFDWKAFKVKLNFTQAIARQEPPQAAQQSLAAHAQSSVDIKALIRFDSGLNTIPDKPRELGTVEKVTRTLFKQRTQPEREARQLRIQAQSGRVDEQLKQRVQQSAQQTTQQRQQLSRRTSSALFAASFRKFIDSMNQKTGAIENFIANTPPQRKAELAERYQSSLVDLYRNYKRVFGGWFILFDETKKEDRAYLAVLQEAGAQFEISILKLVPNLEEFDTGVSSYSR